MIYNALKTLGVNGTVNCRHITYDRVLVTVDGEYFGIWDSEKKTFVD